MKAHFDNVINVPIECDDISQTMLKLPRNLNDAKLVPLQLKRRLEYKNVHDGIILYDSDRKCSHESYDKCMFQTLTRCMRLWGIG